MDEPAAVRVAQRLGEGPDDVDPRVDVEGGAVLGEEVVEPYLARVVLEDDGRPALVVDEVHGARDAGVVDALEDGELPPRRA